MDPILSFLFGMLFMLAASIGWLLAVAAAVSHGLIRMFSLQSDPPERVTTVTIALIRTIDGQEIVNAQTEAEAYSRIFNPNPKHNPGAWHPFDEEHAEKVEWECTMLTLAPGERCDPSRY